MMNLIIGIVIGLVAMWFYQKSKTTLVVAWFAWVLFVFAAASMALGFDIFAGSIIEHEMQAGWMGLGMCLFASIVTGFVGWRYGVIERNNQEGGKS
jgi:hypothetical protein